MKTHNKQIIIPMKIFNNLLCALATLVWLASCTDERLQEGNSPVDPDANDEAARREVLLTLDNKLVLGDMPTRADELISTKAENTVSALDVYVFGSTIEAGPYTYMERFAYRAKGELPEGAGQMKLNVEGEKNEKLNAILNLKKGFFVRLYCVANQTDLADALKDTLIAPAAYKPMEYTLDENGEAVVSKDGVPTEEVFKTYHAPFIDPHNKKAVLNTPLPMVGAQIVPLDLRNIPAVSRVAAGFRMERPLVRFDVRNDAKMSRVWIDSISITGARKGVTFFPIRPYGDRPTASATDEYRLQYNLTVAEWNDEGSVDDYEPDNSVDEFSLDVPEAFKDKIEYDTLAHLVTMGLEKDLAFTLITRSNTELDIAKTYKNSVQNADWLVMGNPTMVPVVSLDQKYTREYIVPISLNPDYEGNLFPQAFITFANRATGDEHVMFIKRLGIPSVGAAGADALPGDAPSSSKLNEYDAKTGTARLLRAENSQLSLSVFCTDKLNIQIPEAQQAVYEVTQQPVEDDEDQYLLLIRLLTADYAGDPLAFTVENIKNPDLKETIQIELVDTDIKTEIPDDALGSNVEVSPAASNASGKDEITVPLVDDNVEKEGEAPAIFTINAQAIQEVQTVDINFDEGSEWLCYELKQPETRAASTDNAQMISFYMVKEKLAGAKPATVTIVNGVTGADNYEFIVRPKIDKPTIALIDPQTPADNQVNVDGSGITLYKLPKGNSVSTLEITYWGGVKEFTCEDAELVSIEKKNVVSDAGDSRVVYTLKPLKTGTSQLTITSQIADVEGKYPSESFTLDVKDPQIQVSEASKALSLNMETDATVNIEVTQALKGCTIETNWADSGQEWFTLSSEVVDAMENGSTTITAALKSDLINPTKDNVKEATITFKNNIVNGGDVIVKISPKWMVPTNKSGQAETVSVYAGGAITINVDESLGGVAVKSSNTVLISTAVNENNQIVVTFAEEIPSATTATLTVYNKQVNYDDLQEDDKLTYTVYLDKGYISMGDLDWVWAIGHLMAEGQYNCKIGNPTDYGLYFTWGGLLGYTGSNSNTPAVKPAEYKGELSFLKSPCSTSTIVDSKAEGKGDPCRIYLGGKWRMPTAEEVQILGGASTLTGNFTNCSWQTESGVAGGRIPKTAEPHFFFPASGYLSSIDGKFMKEGEVSLFWSSSNLNEKAAYRPYFSSSTIAISQSPCTDAFPIRCVRDR